MSKLSDFTDALNLDADKRRSARERTLKKMRASSDAETKLLFKIAEADYRDACPDGPPLDQRSAGFQMRLLDDAGRAVDTYIRVKRVLEKALEDV